MSLVCTVFKECVAAIRNGVLIEREGGRDKEFHFQNWFKQRLEEVGQAYDEPGRNTYPDFTLVRHTEGYELKGLAYPGRDASYDCNSQIPRGEHNGRQVFYVFGRYPKSPDGNRYPVLDLVICHGSFLNADNDYVHENKSFRSFGSYGDILVRDRKMYVAPTPFALAEGTAHHRTLILPAEMDMEVGLSEISTLTRREAKRQTGLKGTMSRTATKGRRSPPRPCCARTAAVYCGSSAKSPAARSPSPPAARRRRRHPAVQHHEPAARFEPGKRGPRPGAPANSSSPAGARRLRLTARKGAQCERIEPAAISTGTP